MTKERKQTKRVKVSVDPKAKQALRRAARAAANAAAASISMSDAR